MLSGSSVVPDKPLHFFPAAYTCTVLKSAHPFFVQFIPFLQPGAPQYFFIPVHNKQTGINSAAHTHKQRLVWQLPPVLKSLIPLSLISRPGTVQSYSHIFFNLLLFGPGSSAISILGKVGALGLKLLLYKYKYPLSECLHACCPLNKASP